MIPSARASVLFLVHDRMWRMISRPPNLAADLTAGEVARTGVDLSHSVVGVHVDVRPAGSDRREQHGKTLSRERPRQVAFRDDSLGDQRIGGPGSRVER